MKDIIYLDGKNLLEDKEKIERTFKELCDPVFVFDGQNVELHQYIEQLHKHCVENDILSRLRICKETDLQQQVTLSVEHPGGSRHEEPEHPANMRELLKCLTPGTRYHMVIENNDRILLANVIQQLVYIDYPITEIDFRLRREYKDAAKTARFMMYIDEIFRTANEAVSKMKKIAVDPEAPNHEELQSELTKAINCYEEICSQIGKAKDVEMKVAVAASKKTGKSVLTNCMFGMELAPTSLELATPNCCIYRKSTDEKFHLLYKDKTLGFSTGKELFKFVQKEFETAQVDQKGRYAIPDMEIQYVSNGNNFESFTIYDTPGPDAAGTDHRIAAQNAIERCDVAVFAIDYSKYLTDSEETYLKEIKEIFEKKGKFHTLIFVLNKMDLALNDKGTKSRVKSIDFIRCRLREIDPGYGDCVIFATSAQDYFYTLEIQNAKREELSVLFGPEPEWENNLRPVCRKLDTSVDGSADLKTILSNLDAEVGKLYDQLGYRSIDHRTVQNYSGIPQLMNYISYVAQSKAREEIVNSITFTIDQQCRELGVLINNISNIKNLMGKTKEEISKITEILAAYKQQVEETLASCLTERDAAYLDKDGLLAGQIAKYMRLENKGYPIELWDLLQKARTDLGTLDRLYIQEELWTRVSSEQKKRIKEAQGKVFKKDAAKNNRLSLELTVPEIQTIIQNYIAELAGSRAANEQVNIEKLKSDLEKIVNDRLHQVSQATDVCRAALDKQNCPLQLPDLPEFNAAIPTIDKQGNTVDAKISFRGQFADIYRRLGGAKQFVGNVRDFIGDITSGRFGLNMFEDLVKKEVQVKRMSDAELDVILKKMKGSFEDGLKDANVYDAIFRTLKELEDGVKATENRVLGDFQQMNQNCIDTIASFQNGLDDRERYQQKLDDLKRLEELISQIQAAAKKSEEQDADRFFDIWEKVLEG